MKDSFREQLRSALAVIKEPANRADREWLSSLLPAAASEEEIDHLLMSIEYLATHPHRDLAPVFREYFEHVERRSKGDPKVIPDPLRRSVASIVRRRRAVEAAMPGWMNDPSELPKKPPSSAAAIDAIDLPECESCGATLPATAKQCAHCRSRVT